MPGMGRQFIQLAVLLTLIFTNAACTTTTKKLTTTKPRIDSSTQLAEARQAFLQKNYQQAASLLTPLAEQGNADAQYALGYLYHNGLGVPRNSKLAMEWMTIASAKGNKKATEALRRISEHDAEASNTPQQSSAEPSTESANEPENLEPIYISGKKSTDTGTPDTDTSVTNTPATEAQVSTTETTPENSSTESFVEPKQEAVVLPEKISPEQTEITPSVDIENAGFTDNEKWIMVQSDQHFTIQILATGNETDMKRFIFENRLNGSFVYYRSTRKGHNWFTLIQGSYETPSSARKAINNMPQTLQNLKPWVKPFSDIKTSLISR